MVVNRWRKKKQRVRTHHIHMQCVHSDHRMTITTPHAHFYCMYPNMSTQPKHSRATQKRTPHMPFCETLFHVNWLYIVFARVHHSSRACVSTSWRTCATSCTHRHAHKTHNTHLCPPPQYAHALRAHIVVHVMSTCLRRVCIPYSMHAIEYVCITLVSLSVMVATGHHHHSTAPPVSPPVPIVRY